MSQPAESLTNDHSWQQRFRAVLGSNGFFYATVALLGAQALWIALTARYPQAFDEQVHFGLIQLHAYTLSPFFSHQPPNADAYGAVIRDPSYLYHYLFSFPYRLIRLWTHNEVVQILILRCLNILLLCSALPIFKRILYRLGLSNTLTHSALFLFVMTPVVSLLGAEINYDNLIVPLTALLVLQCLRLQRLSIDRKQIPFSLIATIVLICLLGSIVTYAFLPLAFVAVVYSAVQLKRNHPKLQRPCFEPKTVVLILVLLLCFGLFSERYAVNLFRYHTPTPECDQVLTEKRCEAFSPWLRNHYLTEQKQTKLPKFTKIIEYPASWTGRIIEESLFAIGSGFNNGINVTANNFGLVDYWQVRSLVVPRIMTIMALLGGTIALAWNIRKLFTNPALRLIAIFTSVYVAALFSLNLGDFLQIGTITAVHGRYLVPILPFIIAAITLAYKELLASRLGLRYLKPRLQTNILLLLMLLFISQGGGLITYFVRSEQRWFWPQSSIARQVNLAVHGVVRAVVIGANNY